MNIKHKILSFDKNSGSLLVNWYTDLVPDGLTYSIDLHIVNGQYPTKEEIDAMILHYTPTGQLQRIEDLKTANVPQYLQDLIPVTVPIIETNDAPVNQNQTVL